MKIAKLFGTLIVLPFIVVAIVSAIGGKVTMGEVQGALALYILAIRSYQDEN